MVDPSDSTARLLDQRPDFEDYLETIVELDAQGTWTFDDLDCDSGTFGEIVSREFVESVGDGYRLADRRETKRVLDGHEPGSTEGEHDASNLDLDFSLDLDFADRSGFSNPLFAGGLLVSFLALIGLRLLMYPAVFREDHITLTANDPYHYRFWVDVLLQESPGLFALSEIAETLGGRATGEPLTYVVGWWLTVLFELNPDSSGFVVPFIPVIFVTLTALVLAWLAYALTGDQRVTVLSVLFLALTPSSFLRTHLGYYRHNAMIFFLLAVMAATLVWLERGLADADSERAYLSRGSTWVMVGVFGVACGAAMLMWSGAPLLLLPLALYAVLRSASAVRTDRSPLLTGLPLVVGLALGTLIALVFHLNGWQEPAVVFAPLLVGTGALGVAGFAEAAKRVGLSSYLVVAGSGVVGVVGLVGTYLLAPDILFRFAGRASEDLLGREGAAETRGLLIPELSFAFGPVEQFGLLLVLALPAMVYVSLQCVSRHRPRWLVPLSFAWVFFALAVIQRRFSGELSTFAALFAAVGFVLVLARLDIGRAIDWSDTSTLTPISIPQTRTALKIGAVFVLLIVVLSVSVVPIASALDWAPTNDEMYDAATWIEEDSDGDAFVLSHWSRNRMYNSIASGEGDSYGYAQDVHGRFLTSGGPADRWYDRFVNPQATNDSFGPIEGREETLGEIISSQNRTVDYVVVVVRHDVDSFQDNVYGRLVQVQGSRTSRTEGTGHFQLAYVTEAQTYAVYRVVPGATIEGEAGPEETVRVATQVSPEGSDGNSFQYVRQTTADETGAYNITVAYPGTYRTSANETAPVSEDDVRSGRRVQAERATDDS